MIVCGDSRHFNFEEKLSQNDGECDSQILRGGMLHYSTGVRRNQARTISKDPYLGIISSMGFVRILVYFKVRTGRLLFRKMAFYFHFCF